MNARLTVGRTATTLLGLVLLLIAAAAAGQQSQRVTGLTLTPELFHVGDRVVASIVVDAGSARVPAPPAVLPEDDWVVVHAVEVLPHGDGRWEVRVAFSSFQPGVLTLPAIDVGAFELRGIRVQATSLLPQEGAAPLVLRPLRGPLPLPGTAARLLAAAVALLAVPHLLVSAVLALWRRVRRWQVEHARNLPRQRLRQAVQRLHGGATPPGARSFHVQLARIVRTYLSQRLQIRAYAATTRELRAALPSLGLPPGLGSELTAILETADRVKFAGQRAEPAEMRTLSERLVALVDAIDTDLQRRERGAGRAPGAPQGAARVEL